MTIIIKNKKIKKLIYIYIYSQFLEPHKNKIDKIKNWRKKKKLIEFFWFALKYFSLFLAMLFIIIIILFILQNKKNNYVSLHVAVRELIKEKKYGETGDSR